MFEILKEEIKSSYKKEFGFFLIGVFCFGVALFFFIKEGKKFLVLRENYNNLEKAFFTLQPQIPRLKSELEKINFNREFQREILKTSLHIDLSDMSRALEQLRSLSSWDRDIYFQIEEITYSGNKSGNETSSSSSLSPLLFLKGEIVIYR